MYYSEEAVKSRLVDGKLALVLSSADRAWNPCSTGHPTIWGAAIVNYTLHGDGGWNVTVRR